MADKKSLVNIDFGGSSSIKGLPSATAASGDYIVLTDTSDGGKAKKGPSFATNDGKFLRHDGTWATPQSGATKYTHNITLYWSGGSGSSFRQGSLTFSFQDTSANSYATNGATEDESDIRAFLENHCNLTAGKKYPVNGTVQMGTPSSSYEMCFATNVTTTTYDWYVGGAGIGFNANKTISYASAINEEITYLSNLIGTQLVTIYDTVV